MYMIVHGDSISVIFYHILYVFIYIYIYMYYIYIYIYVLYIYIYSCVYDVYVCILGTDGMRLVSVRELCLLQANSELMSEPVKSDWNWCHCMQLKSTKRKITARLLAKSLPCGTPMEISIYMHLQSSTYHLQSFESTTMPMLCYFTVSCKSICI